MLPKIFPTVAQNVKVQGDNTVGSPDCPVHTRLFQALPNEGSAPCLQNAGTYRGPLFLIQVAFVLPETGFGDVPVMFQCMKQINNLGGSIKLFIRKIPYPGDAVSASSPNSLLSLE